MDSIDNSRCAPGPDTLLRPSLHLLLRSSWQTLNIGDVAHTFGLLCLLRRYHPEVRTTLWPCSVNRGVRAELEKIFPEVKIVTGDLDPEGGPDTEELAQAFDEAEVLVHGSGPRVVASSDLLGWKRTTGKPYGLFGVSCGPRYDEGYYEGGTLAQLRERLRALPSGWDGAREAEALRGATCAYFRDTLSLEHVRRQSWVSEENSGFGPDATYACDLKDEEAAEAWLAEVGLTGRPYICVVPRLRWTPYHRMEGMSETDDTRAKDAVNARTRRADHAVLREMILRCLAETDHAVVACPEMTYQVELAREELVEALPESARDRVIWRDRYWLNREASGIYAKASAVVSLENHSPIFALAQGTPTFYVRQPTDTVKGQMWRDLGMADWFFEVEETTGERLWERLRPLLADPAGARELARRHHETATNHMRTALEAMLGKLRGAQSAEIVKAGI